MNVRYFSPLLLVLLTSSLLGQQPSHTGIVKYYPATPIGDPGPNLPMMPMPTVAPLFLDDEHFSSTLVLVNNSVANTYADITLRALDGSTVTKKRLNFSPHSELHVPVASLLGDKASTVTTGSILIMQSSALAGPAIAGALSMTYIGSTSPNYIDEELSMPSETGSEVLQGVADRANGSPLLAISSVAETTQNVTVECFGEKGTVAAAQQIALGPEQTSIVNACAGPDVQTTDFRTSLEQADETTYGPRGIKLTSDAMPGSFAAFALAPHQRKGDHFFSSVLFTDPMVVGSPNTVFAGVPVGPATLLPDGTYTPQLSVTNFSANDIHMRTKYSQTSGNTPQAHEVGILTVPPRTSRELVLKGLEGDPGLQNSFIVLSDGAPGALMAKLVSTSDSQLHEVELQAKDASDTANAGNHPWSIKGDTDSTLLLFNHSDTPQTFDVSIFEGPFSWQKTYKLVPMQTRAVSIRELIDDQAKDDKGKILPKTEQSGEINWMDVSPSKGTGRLLLSDRSAAMARNFSCGYSGLLCGDNIEFYQETFADGTTILYAMQVPLTCTSGQPQFCSGQQTGEGGSFNYSWTSTTPSVASISGGSASAQVSLLGVSAGTTTVRGNVSSETCQSGGGGTATVQVPTASAIVSTISSAAASCPSGYAGWDRWVLKIVTDQETPPEGIVAAGQSLTEVVTIGSPNTLGMTNITTSPATTNAAGNFKDHFLVCSTGCPNSTGSSVATQVITDVYNSNSYTLTPNTITFKCTSITVNGN